MGQHRDPSTVYFRPLQRILLGAVLILLLGLFLFWRIDGPRAERMRLALIDWVVPQVAWATAPLDMVVDMGRSFQSYAQLYEQNQQLRRELQQMKAWKEAALQLEQRNARLLDLNNVRLDPELTYVTGVVLADSGSPFRQSVLLNVGVQDGIRDGWAAMDGIGVVGRVSGVGERTARVILLTDSTSGVPVTIRPSGQKALLQGDNTIAPRLDFIETPELVRPGDRVVTSGAAGVLPSGLLIGQVAETPDGRLRVRLAADYARLEFLRVLRQRPRDLLSDPGGMVMPDALVTAPAPLPWLGRGDG